MYVCTFAKVHSVYRHHYHHVCKYFLVVVVLLYIFIGDGIMEEMVNAEYNDDDIIMHYMSDLKLACVLVLQNGGRVEDGERDGNIIGLSLLRYASRLKVKDKENGK